LKPSTNINALQGLFGFGGFHRATTTMSRDYNSVPTLCPWTTVGSIFPHRPTATSLPVSSTPLQFPASTQKCDSEEQENN